MPFLTQAILARAGRLFLAAMIALAVAGMLGVHHLYWAVIPVWVVFQPYREDMALRAILRVVGTLVGAGVGLAALQELPVPGIALAVASTTAIGVGFAYRIGTTWSYGFTLMALSVGVVVEPALGDGTNGIALAQDRVIATLIGVLAVTAVKWFFTPARAAPMLPRPCPHCPVQMRLRMATTALMTGTVTFLAAYVGDPAAISAGALLRAHPRTVMPSIEINVCFLLASGLGTAALPLAIAVTSGAATFASVALVAGLLHVLLQLHGPTEDL